jgi:uncharacterized membrane protein YhdT
MRPFHHRETAVFRGRKVEVGSGTFIVRNVLGPHTKRPLQPGFDDVIGGSGTMNDINKTRMKVAKRGLWIAWVFNAAYTAAALVFALGAGERPLLFGLPLWVTLSCVIVPGVFVAVLIPLIEKSIPNIGLTDEDEGPL